MPRRIRLSAPSFGCESVLKGSIGLQGCIYLRMCTYTHRNSVLMYKYNQTYLFICIHIYIYIYIYICIFTCLRDEGLDFRAYQGKVKSQGLLLRGSALGLTGITS